MRRATRILSTTRPWQHRIILPAGDLVAREDAKDSVAAD
jgi:hypothetical protein